MLTGTKTVDDMTSAEFEEFIRGLNVIYAGNENGRWGYWVPARTVGPGYWNRENKVWMKKMLRSLPEVGTEERLTKVMLGIQDWCSYWLKTDSKLAYIEKTVNPG